MLANKTCVLQLDEKTILPVVPNPVDHLLFIFITGELCADVADNVFKPVAAFRAVDRFEYFQASFFEDNDMTQSIRGQYGSEVIDVSIYKLDTVRPAQILIFGIHQIHHEERDSIVAVTIETLTVTFGVFRD